MIVEDSRAERAIPMLRDDELLPLHFLDLARLIADILLVTVDKHDEVSVLFDRT